MQAPGQGLSPLHQNHQDGYIWNYLDKNEVGEAGAIHLSKAEWNTLTAMALGNGGET